MIFSPDGHRIASGSHDHTLRVWDAEATAELRQLHGHKAMVKSLEFSPDGRWITCGSADSTVGVWDAVTGQLREVIERTDKGLPVAVARAADGSSAFVRGMETVIEDRSSQVVARFPNKLHFIAIRSDGRVCAGTDGMSSHVEILHLEDPSSPGL